MSFSGIQDENKHRMDFEELADYFISLNRAARGI